MTTITRTTDAKARVCLPKAFANATVIIEQISDTELRIHKTPAVAEEEHRFEEESPLVLSDRDRDLFLAMLKNPPPPNEALRQAVADYKKHQASAKKRSNG
jgi:hypothetical protein